MPITEATIKNYFKTLKFDNFSKIDLDLRRFKDIVI